MLTKTKNKDELPLVMISVVVSGLRLSCSRLALHLSTLTNSSIYVFASGYIGSLPYDLQSEQNGKTV